MKRINPHDINIQDMYDTQIGIITVDPDRSGHKLIGMVVQRLGSDLIRVNSYERWENVFMPNSVYFAGYKVNPLILEANYPKETI